MAKKKSSSLNSLDKYCNVIKAECVVLFFNSIKTLHFYLKLTMNHYNFYLNVHVCHKLNHHLTKCSSLLGVIALVLKHERATTRTQINQYMVIDPVLNAQVFMMSSISVSNTHSHV